MPFRPRNNPAPHSSDGSRKDWNKFRNPDFDKIGKLLKAPVLFDGRNLYNPYRLADQGFIYYGIGRSGSKAERRRLAD